MSKPTSTFQLPPSKLVPTIGIETHAQLKTKTKLFAAVDNDAREAEPNTKVSPICFGLPGTLPYLNEKAVEYAIRAGLALGVDPQLYSIFERKHYFYPDLPMGYQITQLEHPIVKGGRVEISLAGETRKVRINRVQLEADAGKSVHPPGADYTLVDLNRAGTPLLEIVSEPDMHSPEEAKAYVRELYLLMKYAGVSDVDLYHGNMRFDINVSMAPDGELGTRSETKNLNSFRAVERAAAYEIKRQSELLGKGEKVVQETRGWDESKQRTVSQRTKEEAHDYRYFPDPDIPPIEITPEQVEKVRASMPKLPSAIRQDLGNIDLDTTTIETLLNYPDLIKVIEELMMLDKLAGKFAANIIANVWLSQEETVRKNLTITPKQFIELHRLVADSKLSSSNAKNIFIEVQGLVLEGSIEDYAKSKGHLQTSDSSLLESLVDRAIAENPQAAEDVKSGEGKAIGFLTGQVMKLSRGQANPQKVQELLQKKLK